MSKELAAVKFDYASVVKADGGKLMYLAGQIKKEAASHARAGIAIGESVAKAHEILAGDGRDGKFSLWVESECGFSLRTAYNYMHAWEKFGESELIEQYEPSAMYLLASPKAPPAALKEAEKLAKKGQRITEERADELVKEAKRSVQPLQASGASSDEKRTNENGKPKKPEAGPSQKPAPPSPPTDYGKCPNCAGTKWVDDGFGVDCAKCHHPHGEPAGGADGDRVADARSKTIKTAEALMRAFDDLNLLASHPKEHANAILQCKFLLKEARDWK